MRAGSWVGMRVLPGIRSKPPPCGIVRREFRGVKPRGPRLYEVLIRLHSGVLTQMGTQPWAVAALIAVRLESPGSFS